MIGSPLRRTPPSLLALAACAAVAGCVEKLPGESGVMSFEVSFAPAEGSVDTGSEDEPLPYVAGTPCTSDADCQGEQVCAPDDLCSRAYELSVRAIGRDGEPYPFQGPVHIRTTPGMMTGPTATRMMEDGTLDGVPVHLARAYGDTKIWFETDGVVPLPEDESIGQCNDGIDNDDNGRVDQADPGCAGPRDDLEAPVPSAAGVSPSLRFATPTIRDVQRTDQLGDSPLNGSQIRITRGELVVVNVTNVGFYVVDLEDNVPGRLFNGIFVFTFSKPTGVKLGDEICLLSGAVEEHVGMTQLVFPTFEVCEGSADGREDRTPVPWELTSRLVDEETGPANAVVKNDRMLERFEGNLVRFDDVQVATRFVACDRNGNGRVEEGTPEATCRSKCQRDPLCSRLDGFVQFNQFAGHAGGKKKIFGSIALADEFKPLRISDIGETPDGPCERVDNPKGFVEYRCPERKLDSITGALQHVFLCGEDFDGNHCGLQFWVVEPRFDGDVEPADTR